MNQKIDELEKPNGPMEREFSPEFIRVLISLTVATLVLVFAYQDIILLPEQHSTGQIFLYPWIAAAGQTIANGLAEFGGTIPGDGIIQKRLAVLLGIIFGFIIGPTLFFFGWYHRRQDRASGMATPMLKGSGVITVIGGILIFSIAIPAIPNAYIIYAVSSSLRERQAVQENKDQMLSDLHGIAFHAHQYGILPRSLNGGEGSFAGYAIPIRLAATVNGKYDATVASDEITLRGISVKFPDCKVTMRVNRNAPLISSNVTYEGQFQ